MKRILMVTVATIILLWSTTMITAQAASRLQTRSFRTNLVKGEYVEAEAVEIEINENPEVQESVDDGLDNVAEEIITDRAEIAEAEPLDEQESQESDEHTDVPTPTDIESVVDEEAGELEELIVPDMVLEESDGHTGESINPGISENEEGIDETEVQEP